LQAAQDKLEQGMRPELRQGYEKAVHDGWEASLKRGPSGILASLNKSRDPIADCAKGAVMMALLLFKEAKGGMPYPVMVNAAMGGLLRALDFVGQAKIAQVGEPELIRAAHIWNDFLFARMNITKQGFAAATQKIHQIVQDPQAVHQMQVKAGFVRHPMAATPTPGLQGADGLLNRGGGG
jgi:hypothetical protein